MTEITTTELAAWLSEQTWSEFAQSLASFHAARGFLTPKQEASARAMHTKMVAKAAPAPVAVEVPSGHYAIVTEGVVKFYSVNNVTEGKWAGRTFVNAQASDDYFKVGREASARILVEIAQDPEAAMKLYGVELGVCGHCHRTLTSDWRKVGIGPVCNKKMGWV